MTNCRNHNINSTCESVVTSTSGEKLCEPFNICLPFGLGLSFDGECLRLTGNSTIADGEYGVIVVENGCIVDAKPAPVPQYTPAPCAPAVTPCGDDTGGGSGTELQPNVCNLLSFDAAGRLGAYLTVAPGQGITFTGCGSAGSPLVISAAVEAAATVLRSGTPLVLPITGDGTSSNPYIASHKASTLSEGNHGSIITDAYGHVTGVSDVQSGIIGLVPGVGVDITTTSGISTVGLQPTGIDGGTVLLGGMYVSYNLQGQVTAIQQGIEAVAGTYDPSNYDITINEYGSIIGMEYKEAAATGNDYSGFFSGFRDTNTLTIITRAKGALRIRYVGILGDTTQDSPGLVNLPSNIRLSVDGIDYPAYARVAGGKVTEIEALITTLFEPGTHMVEISGTPEGSNPYAFTYIGILDVTLTTVG